MPRQNEETRSTVQGAAAAAAPIGGPKPQVQSETFYVADTSLRDGKLNKNWTLDSPGTQNYAARVFFPDPFDGVPKLTVGITGIDADADQQGGWRVMLTVTDVQNDHFDIALTKQGKVEIHQVDMAWTAWIV